MLAPNLGIKAVMVHPASEAIADNGLKNSTGWSAAVLEP
jgi:hypothetical protein